MKSFFSIALACALLTGCKPLLAPPTMLERDFSKTQYDQSYKLVIGKFNFTDNFYKGDAFMTEACFVTSENEKTCGVTATCKSCNEAGYVYFYAPSGETKLTSIIVRKGIGYSEFAIKDAKFTILEKGVTNIGEVKLSLDREIGLGGAVLFMNDVQDNKGMVTELFNKRGQQPSNYTYSPIKTTDEDNILSKSFRGLNM